MTIIGVETISRNPAVAGDGLMLPASTAVAAPYASEGPLIAGTSKTPNIIDTVNLKTFKIEEYNRSFHAGTRLRVTAVGYSDVWLEGIVTAWDGELVSIDGDLASGVGTYSDWQVNVAGERGAIGPAGPQGATGPAGGPAGPQGPAGVPGSVWRNGNGPPLDSLGNNGDYYLNDLTDNVYLRASSVYTIVANIGGAPGATGAPGPTGPTGPQGLIQEAPIDGAYYSRRNGAWAPPPGGGNVSNSGTPNANELAQWATSSTIKGLPIDTFRTSANFFASTTFRNSSGGDGLNLNGAAGQGQIVAAGASADIGLVFTSKGNSSITFYNANFARFCASFNSAPGSNTFPTFTGNAGFSQITNNPAGNPIVFGSDAQFTTGSTAVTQAASDNTTKIATTAFTQAAIAAAPSGGVTPPQGRLTLQTATPVMTTVQVSKTTMFYTPYVGNLVPLYDGTKFTMTSIGAEISSVTTDTTKNPAAVGALQVLDYFVWNDAGTIRLSHGPAWTNDTTRSAGTALVRVNGIYLNNAAITNGPAAQRGTYVGTARSDIASQFDWFLGTKAANGSPGYFSVWNCYNRVTVSSIVSDTTDSWTYTTAIWRPANGSLDMNVSYVSGLAEDAFSAVYNAIAVGSVGQIASSGIGYDSTTTFSGTTAHNQGSLALTIPAMFTTLSLGFHFMQAIEYSTAAGTTTWYGDGGGFAAFMQSGLKFEGRM